MQPAWSHCCSNSTVAMVSGRELMIHGSGLLASAFSRHFHADEPICVFARGVSNSSELDTSSFRREELLLHEALAESPRLLYFSSCALINPASSDTPYLDHKRRMERLVLDTSHDNVVLRLPQVVGRTSNPNTLTNFLNDRIRSGEAFSVWARAERNLIDVEDIARIATEIVRETRGRVESVASPHSLPMPEIIALFEKVLGKRAIYSLEDRGDPLPIENEACMYHAAQIGLDLGNNYPEQVIRKYYGS